MTSLNRAVFLDRDGVINVHAPELHYYVTNINEFKIIDGVLDAIRELSQAGFQVFVVTNQRGIALGSVTPAQVQQLHAYLSGQVDATGGEIKGFYVCPHDYQDDCACRKPKPGMLLQAAREHGLDLSNSWMVGDSDSDIEAGRAGGCKTAFVGPHPHPSADLSGTRLDVIAAEILSCEKFSDRNSYGDQDDTR